MTHETNGPDGLEALAARASNDVVRFLEALRGCGVLQYAAPDLGALDMTPAPHEALRTLYAVLEKVAGLTPPAAPSPPGPGPAAGGREPTPEPKKGG